MFFCFGKNDFCARTYENCNTCKYLDGSGGEERDVDAHDLAIVVRCKDCIYKTVTEDGEYNPDDIVCGYHMSDGFSADDFCSYGKRKEKT